MYDLLGVQRAIWAREQWDARNPSIRYYGGTAAHYDHVHVELCWEAARTLSYETAYRVIRAGMGEPPVITPPTPPPAPEPSLDPYRYIPILEVA